jgi:aminoglycoside/choline kinase family phosphotransferase
LGDAVPHLAPPLVGIGTSGRMLLGHVDGADLYGASAATRCRIAVRAHEIQTAAIADADLLVARGVPDRRGDLLVSWIRERLQGWADDHQARALLDELDERWAAVQECGLPDTLVHGDAHPGNVIEGERMVFVDWGDSIVGSPAFDVATLTARMDATDAALVVDTWCESWSRSVVGSDPRRALALIGPVSELRMAAVYADFLARIEPSERVYHRADVPQHLDAAVAAASA